jgi:O-antigen/teichoic acid export membrane protein
MTTTIGLMIPIVTMSIYDAVLRFVMDRNYDKGIILCNGLTLTFCGIVFSLILYPVIDLAFPFGPYMNLFYIFLVTECINSILLQFTRAIGKVKLFAVAGIVSSITLLLSNVLLLVIFQEAIKGFLLSLIIADVVSVTALIVIGKTYQYLKSWRISIPITKAMIIYSLPLMPTTIMWWTLGVSDRFLVTYFVGVAANGLYAVANKIPNVLNIISSVFFQAWQMSAIEEVHSENRSHFFSNVFSILSSVMFLAASIIIIFLKFIMNFIVAPSFFETWKLIPFLIIGVIFSCFSSFFGQIYVANKNTVGVFKTSIICAIVNVVLNVILIPTIGTIGASLSTMISFVIMWVLRIIDTKSFVTINLNLKKVILNLAFLFLQIVLLYISWTYTPVLQVLLFCLIIYANRKEIHVLINKSLGYVNQLHIKN